MGRRATTDAPLLLLLVCSAWACGPDPVLAPVEGSSGEIGTTEAEPDASSSSTGSDTTSTSEANESSSSGGPAETTEGVASTGELSLCGDGVVDPTEECDDGNTNDQDLCHDDCTVAYSIEYTLEFDAGAGEDESVGGLAVRGDAVWLAGGADDGGGAFVPYLWQLGPDATRLTTWSYVPPGATTGRWASVATHPSGDLIVAGYASAPDLPDHAILARVDPAQAEPVWLHRLESETEESYAADVEVGPDGQIIWGGHREVEGAFFDLFVQSVDADGGVQWDREYGGAHQRSDYMRALDVDAQGRVFVAAMTQEDGLESTPWIGAWRGDGTPEWSASLDSGEVNELVVDHDGELVLTGRGGGTWIERRSPDDFTERSHDVIGSSGSFIESLAVDGDGGYWTVGSVSVPGLSWNIWTTHVRAGAEIDWENAFSGDAGLNDFGRAVVRDGDAVVAAGTQIVLGEGSNIWVRRYGIAD